PNERTRNAGAELVADTACPTRLSKPTGSPSAGGKKPCRPNLRTYAGGRSSPCSPLCKLSDARDSRAVCETSQHVDAALQRLFSGCIRDAEVCVGLAEHVARDDEQVAADRFGNELRSRSPWSA